MRRGIELSTRCFNSQKEATAFFRAMLHRYQPGDRVGDDDHLDLAALLERHPEYKMKVGRGINHFKVAKSEPYGTQGFHIVRADGTDTDFSYLSCISGRPPSQKQEVSEAFREAVRIDIYRARDVFFASHIGADGLIECAKTGERIPPGEGHMDHLPPMTFQVIVTTFLCARGLAFADVPLTTGQDNQSVAEITDLKLIEAFRAYHAMAARLDFIKKSINLAQSSRNRLKVGRVIMGGA